MRGLARAVMFSRTLSAAGYAVLAVACVVTTHEGTSEPPRGAVKTIWPPLGQPGSGIAEGEPVPEPVEQAESQEPGEALPETIAASHILVMYQGSTRAPDRITRSKEEARKRADAAHTRARAGEDFAKLVAEFSDEPGAADRGGHLGRFRRGMMIKPFEQAVFRLKPGEISAVVETEFGFHIILRTE
jgi:peptidyl-prolyl cis-trans isomerase NIMA-interacting 1